MNTSRLNKLPPKNTLRYKKLLQSGNLGTVVAGKAVKILDAENLEEGNFVRCEVIEKSKNASYIGDLTFIDIPEISLLRYIATQGREKFSRTRMIVGNGATIGSYDTMHIESYEPETHELTASCTVGGGKVRLKVPITFSTYQDADLYKGAKEFLKGNPTQPPFKPSLISKRVLDGLVLRDPSQPPPLPPPAPPQEKPSGPFSHLFRRKKAS